MYDLRVDEHTDPISELARLVRLRGAQLIDDRGERALDDGKLDEALALFAQARAQAPELEELAFWQGVTLADKHANVAAAAAILRPVLANDLRRAHWIDLIGRLAVCGLIEREGADAELIDALNA
jgi:predicted Zn-dependent protease